MNGRHGSHRNATSPRRSVGVHAVAARRRGVWLRTPPGPRHLNLIPGCVWSLASPAAYIARRCVRAYVYVRTRMCAAVKVHSRTRYHKQGRVTAFVIPDRAQGARRAERGPRLGLVHWRHSTEGWYARTRARTRAPCTWHAEVDSATWGREQPAKGSRVSMLFFK